MTTFLCLCLAACIAAVSAQPYANPTTQMLPTGKLAKAVQVNLAYEANGNMISYNQVKSAPCTNATFGAPCLKTYDLQAARDSVFITYQLNTSSGFTPPTGAKVKLQGCYSKFSGSGRPWRTAKTLVAKDKQCPWSIAKKLPAPTATASQQYTWELPDDLPMSSMFVRAYVMLLAANGTNNPVAYGNATTYFMVNRINSRPSSLISATIGLCFVGPFLLTVLMVAEKFYVGRKRAH